MECYETCGGAVGSSPGMVAAGHVGTSPHTHSRHEVTESPPWPCRAGPRLPAPAYFPSTPRASSTQFPEQRSARWHFTGGPRMPIGYKFLGVTAHVILEDNTVRTLARQVPARNCCVCPYVHCPSATSSWGCRRWQIMSNGTPAMMPCCMRMWAKHGPAADAMWLLTRSRRCWEDRA